MRNIEDRKKELLNYSAKQVRNDSTLFAEFVFIYTSEGGRKQDCMSCKFASVFERWKRSSNIKKTITMSNNTFKLKNPSEPIYVPFTGDVITKDSTDELVNKFLNQEKGKYKEARTARFFEVVPEKKKKAVKAKPAPKKD